jgi:transcriptional antiterminator RfaH
MLTDAKSDSLKWYVIHTHPKQESRAVSNLKLLEVETFAPRFKERRYNEYSSTSSYVINMLFPRYVFARINLNAHYHKIRYTRGVHSFVTFDNNPALVDQEIIDLMKGRVNQEGLVRMSDELEPGDEVIIRSGPFKNIRGIFERASNDSDRLLVILDSISYQPRIVVNRNSVERTISVSH